MRLAMDFAVAYTTDEAKIGTALQAGRIDSGDMVLVIDSADDIYGHLVIIDKNNQEVKVSTSMRKFGSKADATQWLNKTVNKPVGEIVSIRTGDTYKLNIVNATAAGSYDFTEVSGGGGGTAGVTSVNGKTGDVTITTDDIPAGTVSEVFTVADKTALTEAINNITLIQNTMFNKTGDTMEGNINMDGHDISNIQRIHVNGNAPLYIGSTIEPAGTNGTRITGTTAGEISFVKADTQNTLNNINVADPTNATHAATKKYVDESIANNAPVKSVNTKTGDVVLNATDVGAVPTTGGTLTGDLVLNGAPTANNMAATKKYVDDSVAAAGNVPPSTAADQGKVLTVDAAGTATWQTANSDAVLVVAFTEAGGVITADHTVAEIVAEHAKNKEVIGVLNDTVYQLIDATANHVEFSSANDTGIVTLSATTGAVFTKTENTFAVAEPTTTAEAGKVLIVNAQGVPEWTDMPDGKFMLITINNIQADKTFTEISNAIDNGVTTLVKQGDVYFTFSAKSATAISYFSINGQTVRNLTINTNSIAQTSMNAFVPVIYGVDSAGKYLGVNAAGNVEAVDNPIPNIATADAGKVLTAKADGTTEWSELQSDSVFNINITKNDTQYSADKTVTEIGQAIDNKMSVVATYEGFVYHLYRATDDYQFVLMLSDAWCRISINNTTSAITYDKIDIVTNMFPTGRAKNVLAINAQGKVMVVDGYAVPAALPADAGKVLIAKADGTSEWVAAGTVGGVTSVNNKTGDVVLTADDIGAVKSTFTAADSGKLLTIGADGNVVAGGTTPPTPAVGDAGKVMVAKADGTAEWVEPHYVPAGGTANQVLAKVDGDDYNVEWKSIDTLPTATAANEGQYLTVNAAGSAAWADIWDCGEIV